MSTNRRNALFLPFALALQPAAVWAQSSITVFAAASLTDSLQAVAGAYKAQTGNPVILSFGASSTLARQIDQGARADLFLSADSDWMDYLQKHQRIADASRMNLLGNRLVLIAARDAPPPPPIAPGFNLSGALGTRRLAVADPASVPAGKYAKSALSALGVWHSLAPKIAPAENVRVALEYVARGEAPYGIVYETDVRMAPHVRVAGIFPPSSHPAIVYPMALTRSAAPGARDFLTFLQGTRARAIFTGAGFQMLQGAR